MEGHLLAKRGITGTSELAMRSSPWEKGGTSVTPWCALTQEAPQKNADGVIEWEIATLLIGPTDACTHLQGSGSDPTLKLGPQRTITEKWMVKSLQAATDKGSGQQAGKSKFRVVLQNSLSTGSLVKD